MYASKPPYQIFLTHKYMATIKGDAETNVSNAAIVQDCTTDLQQSGQAQFAPPSVLDKILAFLEDINKRLASLEHLPTDVDGIKASIRHVESMLSESDEKCNAQGDHEPKIKEARKRSMPSLDKIDHQASEILDKDNEVQHYSMKKRVKQTPIWNEDTDIILELSDDDVKEVTNNTVTPYAQHMTFIQRRLTPGSGVPSNLPRSWEKGKSKLQPNVTPKDKETMMGSQFNRSSWPMLSSQPRHTSRLGRKISSPQSNVVRPPKLVTCGPLGHVPNKNEPRRTTLSKVQNTPRKASSSSTNRQLKTTNSATQKGKRFNLKQSTYNYLTTAQVEMHAYVFCPDQDANEVIIKIGDTTATRQELDCLSPGKEIDDKIIKLIALKCTWRQQHITLKTVWCLPPSFAEDVFQGATIEDLINQYGNDYMQPYPELKFIYVPIKEYGGNWYLMVVCLDQKIIYHLDSFLPAEQVEPRREIIKTVGEVLAQIMSSEDYVDGLQNSRDFTGWEVMEAPGLPKRGHGDLSGVWVLGWLDMEYAFNPNALDDLPEDDIRIRTTTELVLGDCNERKKIIETKFATYWKSLIDNGY